MPSEPTWVTPGQVARLNKLAVDTTGEPYQIVRPELLESACERPRSQWAYGSRDDIVLLAVALLFGIAKNHPFIQGNKRAAYAAMIAFLETNGFSFEISDHDPNGDFLIGAIEGRMTENEFIQAIRPGVCPL